MASPTERVEAQVENWLSKLLDFSRRNRLLYFKESRRGTLRLVAPSPSELFGASVNGGRPFRFWVRERVRDENEEEAGAEEDEPLDRSGIRQLGLTCSDSLPQHAIETAEQKPRELAKTLRRLSSKAKLDLDERGVRVLHVAFGMLDWQDPESEEWARSPIVMVPVALSRESRQDPWQLAPCDEETVLNPALALKLERDLGVSLPDVPDDWDDKSLAGYLDALKRAVRRTNWSVADEAWLGLFSFHKLPMYHDLDANRQRLCDHSVIARLSGVDSGPDPDSQSVVSPDGLDSRLDPKDSFLVVDADSSQLAAIETVKLGTNLVLHGPPGTGKSQTITNVIAEMLAAGKTVLFVSEKMAALEVVFQRVEDAHLAHFCLELHSHKASRRAVVEELHQTMQDQVRLTGGLPDAALAKLAQRRGQLNGYVDALHETRQPLGRSVRRVLAEVAGLRGVQERPVDAKWAAAMDAASEDWLQTTATRMRSVWAVVLEGEQFPWYGFIPERYDELSTQPLEAMIREVQDRLGHLQSSASAIACSMGLEPPSTVSEVEFAGRLAEVFRHAARLEAAWLKFGVAPRLKGLLVYARGAHAEVAERRRSLLAKQGEAFLDRAGPRHREALRTLWALLRERCGVPVRDDTRAADVMLSARWFGELQGLLPRVAATCQQLGSQYGVNNSRFSMRDAESYVRLAELTRGPRRPPSSWLTADGCQRASSELEELAKELEQVKLGLLSTRDAVERVSEAAQWLAALPSVVADIEREASALAAALGLEAPSPSLRDARNLVVLGDLGAQRPLPYREWLDEDRLGKAEGMVDHVEATTGGIRSEIGQLLADFHESLFTLDLPVLQSRFAHWSETRFAFLRAGYRADLRTVRQCAKRKLSAAEAIDAVDRASRAEGLCGQMDTIGQKLFGPYYTGIDTDFSAVRAAMAKTREILRHLPRLTPTDAFLEIISQSGTNAPEVVKPREALRAILNHLIAAAGSAGLGDLHRIEIGSGVSLVEADIATVLSAWHACFGSEGSLLNCVERVRGLTPDPEPTGLSWGVEGRPPLNVAEVVEVLQGASDVLKRLDALDAKGRSLIGEWYDGLATDFAVPKDALAVAVEALGVFGGRDCPRLTVDLFADADQTGGGPWATAESLRSLLTQLQDRAAEAGFADVRAVRPDGSGPMWGIEFGVLAKWLSEVCARLAEPLALLEEVYSLGESTSVQTVVALEEDVRNAEVVRETTAALAAADEELRSYCGDRYDGPDSEWDDLLAGAHWAVELTEAFDQSPVGVPTSVCERALTVHEGGLVDEAPTVLARAVEAYHDALDGLAACFEEGCPSVRGVPLADTSLEQACDRLVAMSASLSHLDEWVQACKLKAGLEKAGLHGLAQSLWSEPPPEDELLSCMKASVLNAWLRDAYANDDRLNDFRVEDHERVLSEFRTLDRQHSARGAARVVERAAGRHAGSTYVPAGSEREVLLKEAHKQRRHLPIRRLFERIPNLLTELKPCLLMSPLSVSQFLSPDMVFDLVVFDEASQICSEDAAGAIYRGGQVLICGDQRQLPPTDFFQKTLDDDTEEGEQPEEEQIEVYESVLDECLANGLREAWLRWHYRSRHESLIAFSNHTFYDYRLVTFPSATNTNEWLGVRFVHVPDGVYDRGGKRTNVVEAQKVADLVLGHLRDHPGKSLGVVSFSVAQAQAIEDELEVRATRSQAIDAMLTRGKQNGFFVKNLENVQGDERDVMLFTIGYGRDRLGRLWMNFGPLSQGGGERRLNVAITRARERVILVSSIRAADIDPSKAQSAGVRHLHAYLDFAERGIEALDAAVQVGSRDYDSPLERDVADAIRQMGYDVEAQVGCSGYRVDLGVRLPGRPGRFILGVECDGAMYHSGQTARDRDRLRQEVLEALGWRIHRVWSPAWVRRRGPEVERLRQALRAAEEEPELTLGSPVETCTSPEGTCPLEIARTPVESASPTGDARPAWTEPYLPCRIAAKASLWCEFHDPACRGDHAKGIAEIVSVEGPVHIDVVARRLADAWGLQRIGSRMRRAVESATRLVVGKGLIERRGDILWPMSDTHQLAVRVPVEGEPETERRLEHIPPEEIVLAMQHMCRDGSGIERDALITETARVFSIHRVGHLIGDLLTSVLTDAIRTGQLIESGGTLLAPSGGGAGPE